jgi:hypothetical protein
LEEAVGKVIMFLHKRLIHEQELYIGELEQALEIEKLTHEQDLRELNAYRRKAIVDSSLQKNIKTKLEWPEVYIPESEDELIYKEEEEKP